MRTMMCGSSLLVFVLVGGAGSWLEVLLAQKATCAPSRTTNRNSVEVPQTQFIDSLMDIRGSWAWVCWRRSPS